MLQLPALNTKDLCMGPTDFTYTRFSVKNYIFFVFFNLQILFSLRMGRYGILAMQSEAIRGLADSSC
jgi:hypothetical protein